jgi:hypothetical protein
MEFTLGAFTTQKQVKNTLSKWLSDGRFLKKAQKDGSGHPLLLLQIFQIGQDVPIFFLGIDIGNGHHDS